jgi:hypothetical protein
MSLNASRSCDLQKGIRLTSASKIHCNIEVCCLRDKMTSDAMSFKDT